METMPVRLIALDIDGTLLDSRWQLSEANRSAVSEAARRGIEVALVTGRRYDFAMPIAHQFDCPLTMIVNNGALIRTADGETHLRHLLTEDVARSVLEATKRWREGAAVIFDRPVANQIMLESLREDDSIRYAYYKRNLANIGVVSPLENSVTEAPIQVMFSGTVAEMRAIESILRKADFAAGYRLAVTLYESRDFAMIDVLPADCTKGRSLAEWATRQGLQRDEILAVGDNHNDLEMLQAAGIPVVMANGVPELKIHGWHETLSNDESGVAAAIERFALSEARCA
jgi:Cof subfamily protein (haloacid dehalogenase superfamily)